MESWIDTIEELLIAELNPSKLIIEDKTHLHVHHAGHDPSKNHLKIEIDSSLFNEKSKIEQHKMVLNLLKPYMKKKIHSVSIVTNPSQD